MADSEKDPIETSPPHECTSSPVGGVRLTPSSPKETWEPDSSPIGGVRLDFGAHRRAHNLQRYQAQHPFSADHRSPTASGLQSPFNPQAPMFIPTPTLPSLSHNLPNPPQPTRQTIPTLAELQDIFNAAMEVVHSQPLQKRLAELRMHREEVKRLHKLAIERIRELERRHERACGRVDFAQAEAIGKEITEMEEVRDGLLEKGVRLMEQIRGMEEDFITRSLAD